MPFFCFLSNIQCCLISFGINCLQKSPTLHHCNTDYFASDHHSLVRVAAENIESHAELVNDPTPINVVNVTHGANGQEPEGAIENKSKEAEQALDIFECFLCYFF